MRNGVFYLTSVWVAAATAFLAGYVTVGFGFIPGTVLTLRGHRPSGRVPL